MTGLVDLNPAHLAIVEHILAEHVPECEVRAFGSRATWNAKDHSDLDLVVVGGEPLPNRTLASLKEAFEESRLPMRVDVIDWNTIAESFRELIDLDTVVVQGAASFDPWPVARLGDCIVTNDETVSPKNAWTYIHYLDTGNITKNRIDEIQHLVVDEDKIPTRARRKVQAGDIVYSTVRPNQRHYGLLKDIPENLLASTGFVVIRGKEGVAHTDFVYWLLAQDHIVDYLQAIAEHSTSAYPSIRPSDIEAIEFPLPPLEEQRRIARILGALDAKIELNRRMSKTLEEMARALFQSWFVDFDPVRAKMEGRDTGLPCYLADLFPDRLVDSEMGEIPEGWVHETIYRFANIIYGAPFASNQFNTENEGVPLIRIRDLSTHNPKVSTQQIHKKGHLINPSDIVVGMDGAFRLEVWKGPTSWLNQRVCHFEPKPRIPTLFLVGALQEPLAFFERGKVGTTVIHLGKADLDTIRLLWPSQEILDTFAEMGEPLLEEAVAEIRASHTLARLRDALLPKLISGEIRVGYVERVWESET